MSSGLSVIECGLCKLSYDSRVRSPLIVCEDQHMFCETCTNGLLEQPEPKCPECNKRIEIGGVSKFRLYAKFEDKLVEGKKQFKKKLAAVQELLIPAVSSIINLLQKGQHKQQLQELLKPMAKEQMRLGHYATAIELLVKSIDFDPAKALAEDWKGIGCIEACVGLCENEDLDWYENRSQNKFVSLFDQLALCFQRQGDFRGAAEYYKTRMEKVEFAGSHQIVFGAAVNEHNAGRLAAALELYETTTKLNPGFAVANAMMALIHLSRADLDNACECANRCLALEENNVFALFVVAVSLEQTDKVLMCERLRRLIEIEPTYARAINVLGEAQLQSRNLQQALVWFERCLSVNKAFVKAEVNLGRTLFLLGRYSQAIPKFVAATKKDKSCEPECFFNIGLSYAQINDYRTAIRYFKSYSVLVPNDPLVFPELAKGHCATGDYRAAISLARKSIEALAADPELRWRMHHIIVESCAGLADSLGFDEMHLWTQEFRVSPQMHFCEGKLHFSLQRFSEALTCFQRCLQQKYCLPEVYEKLIETCKKMNDEPLGEQYKQESQMIAEKCEEAREWREWRNWEGELK